MHTTHRPVRLWLVVATLSLLVLPLGSCVEFKLVGASVVRGPEPDGTLTLRLDVELSIPEDMQPAEDDEPLQPSLNQIGTLALAAPDGIDVTGARILADAAMVGAEGSRGFHPAPQVAAAYDREFPSTDALSWSAFHVILDEVDLREARTVAIEIDLRGVPQGTTNLLVAPGYLNDSTAAVEPGVPTPLELAVGADKAVVRVPPRPQPGAAAGEVSS